MDKVPMSGFDTSKIVKEKRFETYRENIGVVFDVSAPAVSGPEFYASIESFLIDDMMLVGCNTVGQRFWRTPQMIAIDGLDHFLVQVYFQGFSLMEKTGEVKGDAGSVVIIDTSRPWKARTPSIENLTLVIPRRLLGPKLVNESAHHGREIPGSHPLGKLIREYILALRGSLAVLPASDIRTLMQPCADLVATALNQFSRCDVRDTESGQAADLYATKTKIKSYIDQHLHDPDLGVDNIAAHFRLSRSQLYRVFGGEGVGDYLRERRLDMACRRLVFTSESVPIYDIGLAVGYRSQAAFSKAFRQRFGVSPGTVRCGRAAVRLNPGGVETDPVKIWGDWLHRL